MPVFTIIITTISGSRGNVMDKRGFVVIIVLFFGGGGGRIVLALILPYVLRWLQYNRSPTIKARCLLLA